MLIIVGRRIAIKKVKDTFMDVIDAKRILRELKLLRHLVWALINWLW
jgi:mitogen-activated protein kinase 1/3